MEQTEAFMSALEDWKNTIKPEINDYSTVLLMISYAIGGDKYDETFSPDSDRPELIKERIIDLINNHKMQEDFLISSLVRHVDEFLEHQITNLGDAISFHLTAKETEEIRHISEKALARLTSPGYVTKAYRELEAWRIITIDKLGKSQRRQWENNRVLDRKLTR